MIGNVRVKIGVKSRGSGTLSVDLNVSGSHYIWGLNSFQHTIGSVLEKNKDFCWASFASPMSACQSGVVPRRMNSMVASKNHGSMRVGNGFGLQCRMRAELVRRALKMCADDAVQAAARAAQPSRTDSGKY